MKIGKWKKLCVIFVAFFAIVIFCSCSCSCSEEPEAEISVNSLVLSTDAGNGISVRKNQRFTISFTTTPTNAKVPGVYISSSNSLCVMAITEETDEYHGEAEFLATGVGKSIITFISKDGGHKRTCEVSVYEPTVLTTPSNIRYDGTKIVWDETSKDLNGADRLCDERYKLSITSDGSTKTFTLEDNQFLSSSLFTFEQEKHYSVSVQAIGDEVKNSSSQVSGIYQFYILGTPKYSVENGDVRWYFVQSESSNNNPNFYKIQYSEAGDYELVANPNSKSSNNIYMFSENLQDINDFFVSIQALKLPNNLTDSEVRALIDDAEENGTAIHGVVNGIDYISSAPTNGFALHRTIAVTDVRLDNTILGNLSINNLDFENAYQPSILRFEGESDYYLGRIKYNLTFKNLDNNKAVTIALAPGVTEYELGEDFQTDVVAVIGEKTQSVEGSVVYYLTNYSVNIYPIHATSADVSSIIIGQASGTYSFTYFNAPANLLDIEVDTTNAILTYVNPTHGGQTYFENIQFIFVNPETKDYKIVVPDTDVVDLKSALQGLQGTYQIWLNLQGLTGVGSALGSINKLGVKFQNDGGEAEVIETISAPTGLRLTSDGTILWNRVEGAKEYRVELKLNDITTYSAVVEDGDAGNTYNLHTLLADWDSSYDELTIGKSYEIRVVSIAEKEGVIDSASDAITFQKLNQVQNLKYSNGVISWDALSGVTKYMISINNGTPAEVLKSTTSKNVYEDKRLYSAIYSDATMENTISIWAVGAEGEGTTDSLPVSIKVSKSKTPNITKVSNGKLYWESSGIEGDAYKITIETTNNVKIAEVDGITENFYDLIGIESTENLRVSIIRYSDVTFNSTHSNYFYFRRLSTPETNVLYKNGSFYLAWNPISSAEGYQVTGISESPVVIKKADEATYLNDETGYLEYKLTDLNDAKKYYVAIIAQVESEYLVATNSPTIPALVASKTKTLIITKLPKVTYSVEENHVRWSFTDWSLYDEYENRLSEFGYDLKITNSKSQEVISITNLTVNQSKYLFNNLEADKYFVGLTLKSSLGEQNAEEYIIHSDVSSIEVTKLKTVELGIDEGKLVFDRTVEGEKSTNSSLVCDYYSIYANGILLTASDYEINEDVANGKMIVSLNSLMGGETSYSVIVRRTSTLSQGKYFINSDESTKLKAKNINIESFDKIGNNFEFVPAVLVEGEDVAHSYVIEGRHTTNSGYGFYQVIEAGDENYFVDGKYIVPVGALSAGAGEYVFNIKAIGQEVVSEDTKVAYLGDSEGKTISVIVLNSPTDSQALIENGAISLVKYTGVSENPLDIPNKVVITFEKFNEELGYSEAYGEAIELVYANLEFTSGKYIINIPENYLEAGGYELYVQFLGDGNKIVSSAKVQGNRKLKVSKIESTEIFVYDGELCWNEISGASYRLYFDGEEDYTEVTSSTEGVTIANNIVTLDTGSWSAGRRTLKIQVVKDGSLPSSESDEFVLFKLNAMNIEANSDNGVKILSWANVLEGATDQLIYLDEEVIDTIGVTNSAWVITTNQEVGSHNFSMISKGSVDTRLGAGNIGYLTSDASNEVSINFIEPTVKTTLKNGIVEWTELNGILTYEVSLYKLTGYPETKELVGTGTSVTTNKTTCDLNDFGIISGTFVLEVEVASIDPLSEIMTSSHEEITTNYLKLIKVDKFGDYSIYSNIRVENGKFAFDITSNYLESYKELLKSINTDVEPYDELTLETIIAVINDEADAQTKQLLYSLVNFNAKLNNKLLTGLKPSGYNLMLEDGYLTLYYDITLGADTYEISFAPIGNSCGSEEEVVIGVLNGDYTEAISAVKPDKPICPTLLSSGNSIVKGILIWSAPTGFVGNYIVEFKEVSSENVITKVVAIVNTLTEGNVWEAVVVDGKIQLDLNNAVSVGELKQGVEYVISIYTEGTINSNNILSTDTKYLTGVKNTIERTFISLETPTVFRADGGEIYWSTVASAIGYELFVYGYNTETSEYDIAMENHQGLFFEVHENRYSLIDNEDLPAGRYMVGIKAKGDGNYKIDSPIKYAYFVKLGIVQVYVENGYFAFDGLLYNAINNAGEQTGTVKEVQNYILRIKERNSAVGNTEHDWISEISLTKVGTKYYFELPDELREEMSDYKLEVYAMGDDSYLLSGNISSSLYFTKSEVPTGFSIDKNGIISWSDLEGDYFYAVYVRPTGGTTVRVDFDGVDYTSLNSFDINSYAKVLNKYREYELYIKALHNNQTDISKQNATNTELISSKSIVIKLNVVAPPTIKLASGDINWQSDSFETIEEEVTTSYLIIKGKILVNGVLSENEQTIKVKCSADSPLFVNSIYFAKFTEESNESYYLIDLVNPTETSAKVTLAGGEKYSIQVHYIGYDGELDGKETKLCSSMSSVAVSEVLCLETPIGLTGAKIGEITSGSYENYIKWNIVSGASGYEAMVYSVDQTGKVEPYGAYNTASNEDLFVVGSTYAYFALDSIIEDFALYEYLDRKISIEVRAIGSNWVGYGAKNISSNYSEPIEIEYPKAVSNLTYNGAGLITWNNNATGTVVIEITYTINTTYYNSSTYKIENVGLNYSEIVSRETEGVGTITAVDTINIENVSEGTLGMYQMKYLTEDIKSIKVWVETINFVSIETILSSTGENPELSSSTGTNKFMLFNGGDGSTVAPFKIKNETNLKNIRHYLDSHFVIIDNIELTSAIQPIGSMSTTVGTAYAGTAKAFTGTLNGNISGTNAKITNVKLKADEATDGSAYFFGIFYNVAEGASISNIDVEFANTSSSSLTATQRVSYIGGIVANENHGTIQNVNTSGSIYVAGVENNLTNVIHLSAIAIKNYGTITGSDGGAISATSLVVTTDTPSYVGGISYYNYGMISYYGVDGVTLNGSSAGGVTYINAGTIENSYVKATIALNGGGYTNLNPSRVGGGIAGILSTATEATASCAISKCYSEVTVTVQNMAITCYIGGLVGESVAGTINNVYVALVGNAGLLSYDVGKVYGNYTGGTGSNIYYNINNVGTNVAGQSANSGMGYGEETSTSNPVTVLTNLNSNGEAFVSSSSNSIKLSWEN